MSGLVNGEKNWMEGYFRIQQGEKRDPKEAYKSLQQGYGHEHPERVNGFQGLLFGRGDVFVSKTVLEKMTRTHYKVFVYESLGDFYKEKYGDVSVETIEQNGMNRWLGNGDYVMGRYGYFQGGYRGMQQFDEVIRIRKWRGNTWITCDEEADLFLLAKEGEGGDRTDEKLAADKEGVDFLTALRSHTEYYLPMISLQYKVFPEYEGRSIKDCFWNAGILEDNRPYFAICSGKHLEVYTSTVGMGNWRRGEWIFLRMMIEKGLVTADGGQYRQRYPHVRPITEEDGCEYCYMWIDLDTQVLSQTIRWKGKMFSFNDLKKLNAHAQY